MLPDGRNKYTLLKEASQVLDRYEMKFTFDEEGVSDLNGNCAAPFTRAYQVRILKKWYQSSAVCTVLGQRHWVTFSPAVST